MPKRKTPPAEIPADLFESADVPEAEAVPFSDRAAGPNPLTGAYQASLDAGGTTKRVPPPGRQYPTEAAAKVAVGHLRRAAKTAGKGVRVKIFAEGSGFAVQFRAKTEARKPSSAPADKVRAWAREQGIAVPDKGRVDKNVTAAYRKAHGL